MALRPTYQQKRELEALLEARLTRLDDGYCAWIDERDSDAATARDFEASTGIGVSSAVVSRMRTDLFGRIRPARTTESAGRADITLTRVLLWVVLAVRGLQRELGADVGPEVDAGLRQAMADLEAMPRQAHAALPAERNATPWAQDAGNGAER